MSDKITQEAEEYVRNIIKDWESKTGTNPRKLTKFHKEGLVMHCDDITSIMSDFHKKKLEGITDKIKYFAQYTPIDNKEIFVIGDIKNEFFKTTWKERFYINDVKGQKNLKWIYYDDLLNKLKQLK